MVDTELYLTSCSWRGMVETSHLSSQRGTRNCYCSELWRHVEQQRMNGRVIVDVITYIERAFHFCLPPGTWQVLIASSNKTPLR